MNVREVLVDNTLWVRQSSPEFAKLRQSSDEGARMLLVRAKTKGLCKEGVLHFIGSSGYCAAAGVARDWIANREIVGH